MASSGVEMDQLGRLLAERWRRMLLRISLRIPSRLATTGLSWLRTHWNYRDQSMFRNRHA